METSPIPSNTISPVPPTNTPVPIENISNTSGSDFMTSLKGFLGKDSGEINEEELFSALVGQYLQENNAEAASVFSRHKASLMSSMARADGVVQVEDVTNKALEATISENAIDNDTVQTIKNKAFRAAQLDDNFSTLYDSRGSENDPTIATSEMEAALLKAKTVYEGILDGSIDVGSSAGSNDSTTTVDNTDATVESRTASDGAEGFLWKPESDSDGKLVVLLPSDLRGLIEKTSIHSALPPSADNLLETGRFSGDDDNGERPHYRLDKTGAEYGNNVYVVVTKTGGEQISFQIEDGSRRID